LEVKQLSENDPIMDLGKKMFPAGQEAIVNAR
jgi:hypothetical protein